MELISELENSLDCKQGAIRKVVFNADGEYCLTCGSDKTIKLWNPKKQMLLKTYSGHGGDVLDADCSCDSSQIVSGGLDNTCILWDVASGRALRRYRAHLAVVNCVCFNEDSSVFISASVDGTVKLWDNKSNSRESIQVLNEAKDSVSCLAINEAVIATVSLDHHIRFYDIRQGIMKTYNLNVPLTYISFVEQTKGDTECCLVSCLDNTARLFSKINHGTELACFMGHVNNQYRLDNALLYNDSVAASGSEDGNIYIWSVIEKKVLLKLPHHQKVVHSFAVHPASDSTTSESYSETNLVSVSGNKLYLWKIRTI